MAALAADHMAAVAEVLLKLETLQQTDMAEMEQPQIFPAHPLVMLEVVAVLLIQT
jgi:hypothetical protein